MAQRLSVVLTDDLDGGEASETITFGLDGKTYEIDLNDKNAKKLRGSLERYVEKARRPGNVTSIGGRRRGSGSRSGSNPETAKIKEWATANNKSFPARGRLPQSLIDEYRAANG